MQTGDSDFGKTALGALHAKIQASPVPAKLFAFQSIVITFFFLTHAGAALQVFPQQSSLTCPQRKHMPMERAACAVVLHVSPAAIVGSAASPAAG